MNPFDRVRTAIIKVCIESFLYTLFIHQFFLGEDVQSEIVMDDAAVVHGEPHQDGSGPPKVDTNVEVLHEKVTKQIIKEGHGEKPSKYATCFGK